MKGTETVFLDIFPLFLQQKSKNNGNLTISKEKLNIRHMPYVSVLKNKLFRSHIVKYKQLFSGY